MSFSDAIRMFAVPRTIPTLGKRSRIKVVVSGGLLVIENATGSSRTINAQYWEVVSQRRASLGRAQNTTSMYTDPAWHLPPPTDRIFAPYVAAVMRYMEG